MKNSSRSSIGVRSGRTMSPRLWTRSSVTRERLFATLDTVLDSDTDVWAASITAPAGSGKTVLVADWTQRVTPEASVMWLTITDADNDVRVLREAIAVAAQSSGNSELAEAARLIPSPDSSDYRNVGVRLGELLEAPESAVCLVLDDAHLLHDASALGDLAAMIRWAPDTFHLILAGRFEPPILLGRLRLAGAVVDIPAEDIAFTADEARELLSRNHIDELESSVLDAVMLETEGWAAGLQLAALTARQNGEPHRALTSFAGTDRAVSDYLMDEFISSLPRRIKHILMATAIPDAVTGSLAVHLTRNRTAHIVLESLVHNNFLINRTTVQGAPLYRYHPLMRAYLRAEAERDDSCTVSDLHRRAANWYLENGRPLSALEHAVGSSEPSTVIAVLEQCAVDLVLGDHPVQDLVELLDRVPHEARAHSTLRLVTAITWLAAGDLAPAAATVDSIDRSAGTMTHVESALAALLRAQLSVHSDTPDAGRMDAVLDDLGRVGNCGERPGVDATVALHSAATELLLGRLDEAEHHIEQAEAHARVTDSPVLLLHCLGARSALSACTGRFDDVTSVAASACGTGTVTGLATADMVCLIEAHAAYAAALRLVPPFGSECRVWSALTFSVVPGLAETTRRIHALVDTASSARQTADRLRPRFIPERDPLPPHMTALLAADTQQEFLAAGNTVDATNHAAFVRRKLGHCAESVLSTAMIERFHGRLVHAHAVLVPVLDGSVPAVHSITPVWAWIEEVALAAGRDNDTAFVALERALALAESQQLVRPFTRSKPAVRAVLDRNRGRFGEHEEFAETVRRAVKPDPDVAVVKLSPREMDLLKELPSFHTAEEIAADNFVSVNTVKTHLRGIYRKLGVTNRRDAISAAQALGMI